MAPTANESWLVNAGGEVIQKMTNSGRDHLTSRERLVHDLWVVDYCMRNAGDLTQADLMHRGYGTEAAQIAQDLALPHSYELFRSEEEKLANRYFDEFETVCTEIRSLIAASDS